MQLQLTASPRKFLQMLLGLRILAILGQSITVAVVHQWLQVSLPLHGMSIAIAALAAAALLTALRLRTTLPATQLEIALQLLCDVTELTVVLYLSGGTTNPFASLYLIPVAFAAAALAWPYVAVVTLSSLCCYIWLISHFSALALMHANLAVAFDLHMMGMHVTFALSTALLATALCIMAAEMRRRGQSMAAMREHALRHEHLNAMGLLAAGAAHELSTPLFSMAMLISELQAARSMDQQFRSDLRLLERQIQVCKDRLSTLLRAARPASGAETSRAPARTVLQQVLDQWSVVRPAVQLEVDWRALARNPLMEVDQGFPQALGSLLDNAADASAARGSERVKVSFQQNAQGLQITIDDEGGGLDADVRQRAGKAIFTSKRHGFGLGLMLSHANLNRLNGKVTLSNRREGGTRTTISMPICMPAATGARDTPASGTRQPTAGSSSAQR